MRVVVFALLVAAASCKRRGYRVFHLYRHNYILNARMELTIGGSELLGHASVFPMMDEMNVNIG